MVARVIEGCGITAKDLAGAGISREVIDAVVLLTRSEDNKSNDYHEAYLTAAYAAVLSANERSMTNSTELRSAPNF